MIGIIDYRAGNSSSVKNACDELGLPSAMVSCKEELYDVDHIILPGVGSAGETMRSLRELDILQTLEQRVLADKVPFLGICVGMQILFDYSEEGDTQCLGWLKGQVRKYDNKLVRIPQMGWNEICWKKRSELRRAVDDQSYFYFVNSYYVEPENQCDILATTNYGTTFTSMIERRNIFASQCHLEKSGIAGLQILKNFSQTGGEIQC